MAIIQSAGTLQSYTDPTVYADTSTDDGGSLDLYGFTSTYATIYATQPNIRTCVDFLSRNLADLPYHAFRRVGDIDRIRLPEHELIGWLEHPNAYTTRYRLFESLMGDLGVYFSAYWLKVPTGDRMQLLRLPPHEVRVIGGLLPAEIRWTRNGRTVPFAPSQVVHFHGYNPLNPLVGLSPMETLRRVLAEESAAGEHRESYWRHASRMDGVVERPLAAPRWTSDQKNQWRQQWQERFAGSAGTGQVAVLEDGMTFRPTSWSPKDSEYVSARKLTREECASAYHIPHPFVGILDHATFSNIREQHKQLYQDTLGPWLTMVRLEIEAQLLIECDDTNHVYTEFLLAHKLAGSFEEQSTGLQQSIGRPWMTANEGRARMNLPRITDDASADRLAAQQGGPAGSQPTGAPPAPASDDSVIDAYVADVFTQTEQRQRDRLQRVPIAERPQAFMQLMDRWTRELANDLAQIMPDAQATQRAEQFNLQQLARLMMQGQVV